MRDDYWTRDEATRLFVEKIALGQRNAAINGLRRILEGHGSRHQPHPRLHEWFSKLGDHDKEMALEVVREAASAAVGSLVSLLEDWNPALDMENPPPGQFTRVAIYLQSYADEEAWKIDRPSYRSKDVNGYPDPLDLYEKYVDAELWANEKTDGPPG